MGTFNPSNGFGYPVPFNLNPAIIMPDIQVLVIDQNRESLISTVRMLKLYSYNVTIVDLASRALKMISSGKKHFDVIIADVNSDIDGLQFCHQVVKPGTLVLLTSIIEEANLAAKAIESGAFLFMQKPTDEYIIKYLWQFVMNERLRMSKEKEIRAGEMVAGMMMNGRGKGVVINEGKGKNNSTNTATVDKGKNINGDAKMKVNEGKTQKRTYKKRKEPEDVQIDKSPVRSSSGDSHSYENCNKKKVYAEWTKELHEKFMDAVKQLGTGKCFPKEILDLMNVPGLTRMQVASHLQKCRRDNWRAPDERSFRSRRRRSFSAFSAESDVKEREKIRVFGYMPPRALPCGEGNAHADSHKSSQNVAANPIDGESYGQDSTANNLGSVEFDDQEYADFTSLDIPICEDNNNQPINLDSLDLEELNSMWYLDRPMGLWDNTHLGPPPAGIDNFNQHMPIHPGAAEISAQIDNLFATDFPVAGGIKNVSQQGNINSNLPH